MPKTLAAEDSSKALNPILLALKPRQVLLSRPDMGKKEAGETGSRTLNLLKPDEKVLLLRSIAQYLDRCGFSKCLKKFLSEAEIEKRDLGSSLPDLEEIYCQYLKKSNPEAGDSSKQKTEDIQAHGRKEEENAADDYDKGEKNKKETKSENKKDTDVKIGEEEPKNCDSNAAEASEDADKGENNKKKKKKESKSGVTKEKVKDGSSENKKKTDVEIGEGQKDMKKKKKKKNKSKSGESEAIDCDKTREENVSRKRKRPEDEEENEGTMDDKKDEEESKRRKKDDEIDVDCIQKTPAKQPDVEENGNLENTDAKSTDRKSGKNQLTASKEPKKPFQRVNVEEVEFVDERLKDNSYWAKDGADSGYGAKAQEVLGQVRGKGFRHEKTKKKRGSYRGGQIDLHSHSVKFSYSDEE